MKVVLAAFILLDMILLAYAEFNYTVDFATVSSEVQASESPFGNCTARQMWKMHTTCRTPAFRSLREKKACISVAEKSVKCLFDLYKTNKCFSMDDIQGSINIVINGTAKLLCDQAGLNEEVLYQIESMNGGTRILYPCSISEDKYVEELKKCNSKMLQTWKNNTVDPKLCREYFNTKQCQKKLYHTKCNYTGETKTSIDLLVGSYNPFCPGNADFTSGSVLCTPFGTVALAVILFFAVIINQH